MQPCFRAPVICRDILQHSPLKQFGVEIDRLDHFVSKCRKTFDLGMQKTEEIMEKSGNNQFIASLVGSIIGAVVVYMIGRYFGLFSSGPEIIIAGVAANLAVALVCRERARRAKVSSAS